MSYLISYSEKVDKQFEKIDKETLRRIIKYMKSIGELENPRTKGKKLTGNLSGFWRYRVCDFRIVCKIEDHIFTVFVVETEHRKGVYKKR